MKKGQTRETKERFDKMYKTTSTRRQTISISCTFHVAKHNRAAK